MRCRCSSRTDGPTYEVDRESRGRRRSRPPQAGEAIASNNIYPGRQSFIQRANLFWTALVITRAMIRPPCSSCAYAYHHTGYCYSKDRTKAQMLDWNTGATGYLHTASRKRCRMREFVRGNDKPARMLLKMTSVLLYRSCSDDISLGAPVYGDRQTDSRSSRYGTVDGLQDIYLADGGLSRLPCLCMPAQLSPPEALSTVET